MAIVVLHRERSEKLAQRFAEALAEQNRLFTASEEGTEAIVRAFDALIQDGLIAPEQHRAEGRE